MSTQQFDTTDVLRLEVEVPATGLTNLVQNPTGKMGAWGWITPVAGSLMEGDPFGQPNGLTFTAPDPSAASYFTTEPMPIAAGQYAAAAWDQVSTTGYVRVRFEWLNSSYGVLSSSTQSSYINAAGAQALGPQLAPASTAFMRLRFDHYSTTGGANPTARATVKINNVKVAKAATSGALGSTRTNLVTNGSFAVGTTNWFAYGLNTITRVTTEGYVGSHSLRLTVGDFQARAGTGVTVSGGRDYSLQFRTKAATVARLVDIQVFWYDSFGNSITNLGRGSWQNSTSTWNLVKSTFTAPANAATVIFWIQFLGAAGGEQHYIDAVMVTEGTDFPATYFDGATAASGTKTYAWNGASNQSTSTMTDSTLGSLVDTTWRNILGPSADIKTDREGLDLGILTATVLDATLDPTQTTNLRPGRKVRLMALNNDTGLWDNLFIGKATKLEVEYDEKAVPAKPPRIALSAVDNTQALAATKRTQGVAKIADLPFVLEGAGVPWKVNGSGNQVPSATVVSTNDNATALDQVGLTRDSELGYAWVDRFGVVTVQPAPTTPALPNGTFNVDATGWSGTNLNTTLARVTTPVRSGAGSLRLTCTAGAANAMTPASAATPPLNTAGVGGFPVVAGRTYTASAWFRAATTSRQCTTYIYFYDNAGAWIGLGGTDASPAENTSGWVNGTSTSIAPPGAVYAAIRLYIANTANGEIHYVDDVTFADTTPAPSIILDETVYSDFDVSFSSEDCINSVTVKRIVLNADGTSEEVQHGPYESASSIAEWGRRSAEFTVHGISEAAVATYAQNILTRNANPGVRVNTISVPVKVATDIATSKPVLLDIGSVVRVKNTAKGIDQQLRITSMTHRITPEKWMVDYGFEHSNSVASPAEVPEIQNTRAFHEHNAIRGLLSAPQSIASGAWVRATNLATQDFLGTPEVGIVWIGSGQWRIDNPGWYRFEFGFAFNNGGYGGVRFGAIAVAGSRKVAQGYSAGGGAAAHTAGGFLAFEARCTAGQTAEFQVYQDSGVSLNLIGDSSGDYRTWYTIRRIDS